MKIKTTLILLFLGMFLVSFVSADTQQLTMRFFIPINQTDSVVYTYLNNSQANAIVTAGNSIDLNVSLITGDLTSELQLFNNGTLINQGISPLYNSTTFSNVGDLNITGCYVESQNYSRSCEQFNVTVLAVPDTTYPIFSNEVLVPINNSEYTPSTNSVFNITLENTNGTVWLNFDGTDYYATNVSNLFEVDVGQLSVGSYEYNWSSYGNGTDSLFNSTLTSSYTIQINSTLTLGITGTTPITYGTTTDVAGSGCPTELSCSLDKANQIYGVGTETFNYSTAGNNNYSASSITKDITINQIASEVNTTINNTEGNLTIYQNTAVDLNCSLVTGDSTSNVQLYNNGTLINEGNSPVGNTTTFSNVGDFNITCIYPVSQNYTTNFETYNLTVVEVPDTTYPLISFESPTIANGETTSNTSLSINVSISEANLANVTYNWNGTNYSMYDEDLLLMMNFDDWTRLNDTSLYGSKGNIISGVSYNSSGKYYGAYEFAGGSNNYVNISNSSLYGGFVSASKFSVSFWFNADTYSQYESMISSSVNGDTKGWLIGFDNTQKIRFLADVSSGVTTTGVITTGQWHYLTAVFNTNSDVKLYLDGSLNGSGSVSGLTASPYDFILGKLRSEDSDYTFDGKLDELRIWNKTLTASEVSQQYMSNLYKHSSDGWNLEVNQTKNVTDVLENGTYTYQAFATDTSGNLNMTEERTITIGATPTDTCTYSGSGNWNVNCWDNCSIDTSVNLLGNNLWINGTGIFNVLSTIYNYDRIELINDCKLQIINNGNIF